MSFGRFNYHQPETTAEACTLGQKYGRKSAYLAGGTELLVDLRSGRKQVCHVISLGGLDELKHITMEGDILCIGALVPLSEIAESEIVKTHFPALSEVIGTMAGRQIRNLGTMGGNFCCGVPCSDTPPISCAANAEIVLTGPEGRRTVAAREFVLAPRVTVRRDSHRNSHSPPTGRIRGEFSAVFTAPGLGPGRGLGGGLGPHGKRGHHRSPHLSRRGGSRPAAGG